MSACTKVCGVLIMSIMMTAVLAQPKEAEAWHWRRSHWGKSYHKKHRSYHHKHSHYSYPRSFGKLVFSLPRGFVKIAIGGRDYSYHKGVFYHHDHYGYTVVPAPIGACIARLPRGYRKIYVDTVPYYTYKGVYYEHTPEGYVVIERPYSRHVKKTKGHKKNRKIATEEAITLKILNKKGDYISVVLKPFEGGYVGPQDEYYDEFPSVDHLRVIYGS